MAGNSSVITFKVKPLATKGNSIFGLMAGTFFLIIVINILINVSPSESLFLFILSLFLTVFIIVFMLVLVFGYEGMDLDMEHRLWRGYTGFLGLKSGKYEPIPQDLDYILVFEGEFAYYEQQYGRAVTTDEMIKFEFEFYEVSIIYGNSRKQVFLLSEDKEKVIEVADKLKSLFNLGIRANVKE